MQYFSTLRTLFVRIIKRWGPRSEETNGTSRYGPLTNKDRDQHLCLPVIKLVRLWSISSVLKTNSARSRPRLRFDTSCLRRWILYWDNKQNHLLCWDNIELPLTSCPYYHSTAEYLIMLRSDDQSLPAIRQILEQLNSVMLTTIKTE